MSKKHPFSDLTAKSLEELAQLEVENTAKGFTLRFQNSLGQVENNAEIRKARRQVARVKTAMHTKLK